MTPVLLRGPEDRKALRCRLPGPPMAFAAQRVREEAEDAEKVGVPNGLGGKGWFSKKWKSFFLCGMKVPSWSIPNPDPILEVDFRKQ